MRARSHHRGDIHTDPASVIAQAAVCVAVGVAIIVAVPVFGLWPGGALVLYGMAVPAVETVRYLWSALEDLADWWFGD